MEGRAHASLQPLHRGPEPPRAEPDRNTRTKEAEGKAAGRGGRPGRPRCPAVRRPRSSLLQGLVSGLRARWRCAAAGEEGAGPRAAGPRSRRLFLAVAAAGALRRAPAAPRRHLARPGPAPRPRVPPASHGGSVGSAGAQRGRAVGRAVGLTLCSARRWPGACPGWSRRCPAGASSTGTWAPGRIPSAPCSRRWAAAGGLR